MLAPLHLVDMSGSDVAVASFAVLYLRARSWGLPAALVMMVAIGAARWGAGRVSFRLRALPWPPSLHHLPLRQTGCPLAIAQGGCPTSCCCPVAPILPRCRGVKDLNIPLLGSLAYLVGLVAFDLLLLFGPPAMGMEGAGYAASAAQWVGAATVVALLAQKQVRGHGHRGVVEVACVSPVC